ncbi:hypothetical protein CXU01_09675 [Akkermansia muciniphila]|nr:hypothetical protein CXU01_09675 [Akkermansia muciniphila]
MPDIGFITKDILGCYSVKGYGVLSPPPVGERSRENEAAFDREDNAKAAKRQSVFLMTKKSVPDLESAFRMQRMKHFWYKE